MVRCFVGRVPFSSHQKNPNNFRSYNAFYSYNVNKFGGMRKLARSRIARNIWAIMNKFNLPPTDKRLQSLDTMQIDFILEEMKYDQELAEQAAKGVKVDDQVEDESDEFLEKYYSKDRKVNLLADGDDPNDIYEQVKAATKNKDYDRKLDYRITKAIREHKQKIKKADRQIEENWRELEKRLKQKGR